jgi:hypothetical protein
MKVYRIVLLILFFFGIAIIAVFLSNNNTKLGYKIASLNQELARLHDRKSSLLFAKFNAFRKIDITLSAERNLTNLDDYVPASVVTRQDIEKMKMDVALSNKKDGR